MQVLEYCQSRLGDFLNTLEQVVGLESPSQERELVNRLGDYLAGRLEALGGSVQKIPGHPQGDHLLAHLGRGEGKPVLVLCHMDTVFAPGGVGPFRIEGPHARGPGVLDMKCGIVQLLYALEAARDLGLDTGPLRVIINSDEEIGSPTSRAAIEEHARQSRHVLVLEPGIGPDGKLKVARKGVGMFSISVQGRAAHAGADPGAGASAVVELAHQILALHRLNDASTGTTVNVAPIYGGTRSNVVPEQAGASIDVRVTTWDGAEKILRALQGLAPVTPGTTVEVRGGLNRPPMECSPAMAELARRAQGFAQELGFCLETGMTGGASDGNFTAALGVPTLDGLGGAGGAAHSGDEYAVIAAFAPRTALLTRVLTEM
ncbi:MAG: M20 family metallopeptidase [Bacillota bacterium]